MTTNKTKEYQPNVTVNSKPKAEVHTWHTWLDCEPGSPPGI